MIATFSRVVALPADKRVRTPLPRFGSSLGALHVATVALLGSAILTMWTISVGGGAEPGADGSSWILMDDFEVGSITAWRAAGGGSGGWFAYTDGNTAPDPEMVSIHPFAMPDPPQGRSAAVTDMNGWGTFILYRDVDLEGRFTLHLTAFYESAGPLSTGQTLRWDDFTEANQQFRIDVLERSTPFDSLTEGDVLVNVLRSDSSGPASLAPTEVRVDLSGIAGRTVRLRLAVVTNAAVLRAGVDDIRFEPVDEGGEIAFPDTVPAPGAPEVESLALEEPTGPSPVGKTRVRIGGPPNGEATVWLWYPASDRPVAEAPYVTPEQSRAIMLATAPVYGPSWDVLSTTRTHAISDAEPVDQELPLVVLLPGLVMPGSSLSGLAVELASRGYAVAAIDHSVGASGSAAGRAAEAALVVDGLLERDDVRIDVDRIAAIGHSLGGEAAALVARSDPRVRAGVSLDTTFPPDLSGDLDRPFLMLDSPSHLGDAFSSNWRQLTGWRRWVIVDGSDHMSFTDYPSLLEQLGFDPFGATVTGSRATEIIRSYVAAFLDLHLLGMPQRLLEGPSARFPEVSHQDPGQL
jgi:predicted dienelactone hydrolase